MGNLDNTAHLLSQEALVGDWETLSARIVNAIKEVKELSAAAKEITFTIKGDDLLGIINRQESLNKLMIDSNELVKKLTGQFEGLNIVSQQYGETTTKALVNYADLKIQMISINDEIKKQSGELLKLKVTSGDAYDAIKAKLEPLIVKQRELQIQVTNSNNIINKSVDEAVAKRQEAVKKQIEAIESQTIAEQSASIKNKNTFDSQAMSISAIRKEMLALRLAGKELGEEYIALREKATLLAQANAKIQAETSFGVRGKAESYHAEYQRGTIQDTKATEVFTQAEIDAALASDATSSSVRKQAVAFDITSMSVKQLEEKLFALNAILKFATKGLDGYKSTELQIVKFKEQLALVKPEIEATEMTIEQMKVRLEELNVVWETGSSIERAEVLPSIENLKIALKDLKNQYNGVGTEIEAFNALQIQLEKAESKLTVSAMNEAKALAEVNVQLNQQNRINKLTAQETLAVENSYKEMSAELALLDIKLKDYTLDQIKAGESTDVDIIRYKQLVASLKEYDLILGITKRSVGDYKSVLTPLAKMKLEMVDIQRKLTSGELAEGETTEMLTNRYRQLEIEAKKVVAAQNEVNAALKIGKSNVEQFGEMFHRQILRAVGSMIIFGVIFAAFQQLWKLFTEGTDKTIALRKEIEDYNDKLRELGNTAVAEAAKEEAAAKIRIATATNINNSITTRIDAINELRKAYKGLFDDYSDEEIMNNKALEVNEKLTKAIIFKAQIKANEGKMEESAKQYAEAQDKIDDAEGLQKRVKDYSAKRIKELEDKYPYLTKGDLFKTGDEGVKYEYSQLKKGNVDDVTKLFDNTPESRNLKARLEKRSAYDRIFDKGGVNIKEQKDIVEEQKKIQELSLANEKDYLERAQKNATALDLLLVSKKKNIIQLEAELQSLKSKIYSRDLPKDVLDKFYDDSVTKKQFDKFLKSQIGSVDAIETQKLRDEYTKKEDKLKLLRRELAEPKGRTLNQLTPITPHLTGKEDEIKALELMEKERLDTIMTKEKTISEDVKQEEQTRLVASGVYHGTKLKLAEDEYKKESELHDKEIERWSLKEVELQKRLSELKKGDKRKKEIELEIQDSKDHISAENQFKLASGLKYYAKYEEIIKDSTKDQINIHKTSTDEWLRTENDKYAQQKSIEISGYIQQELLLKEQHDKGLLSNREYYKKIQDLQKNQNSQSIESDIKFYSAVLEENKISHKLTLQEEVDYQNKLNAAKQRKFDNDDSKKPKKGDDSWRPTDSIVELLSGGAFKGDDERMLNAKKEFWAKTVDLAQNAFDAINTIRNNAFAQEQLQLQIQQRSLQIQTQQKIQAIEATAGYSIEQKNKESLLVAQSTAKQNQIQAQQNQLALKQAVANKQSAEMGILAKGAEAVVGTIASFATKGLLPEGAPLMAAMIALETGITAAQYAAASSAPLPQFFMGGQTKTPLFSAGEKGFELGVTPQGKLMSFPKNDIYSAPIGTNIYSNEKSEGLIQQAAYNVFLKQVPQQKTQNDSKAIAIELSKLIGGQFKEVGEDLEYAISKSKSIVHVTSRKGGDRLTYKINRN